MSKACPICGAPVARSRSTYCSRECAGKARQNYKVCVVCGNRYPCPPTDGVKTCSSECSRELRQSMHAGGTYDQEDMHRKARESTANDPRLALGSKDHINAKDWIIQSPDGKVYECRNLLQWCREHVELFPGTTPKQIFDGLSKIKYSREGKRKYKSYQYKGWTLVE